MLQITRRPMDGCWLPCKTDLLHGERYDVAPVNANYPGGVGTLGASLWLSRPVFVGLRIRCKFRRPE